jgi:hypothetical protein
MRLKQILLNLLSNACKFTKEGEVALQVRRVADGRDWIELAVTDTGSREARPGRQRTSKGFCARPAPSLSFRNIQLWLRTAAAGSATLGDLRGGSPCADASSWRCSAARLLRCGSRRARSKSHRQDE